MWMRENKTNTSTTLKLTDEEKFTKYMPRDEMRTEEKRPANSTDRLCEHVLLQEELVEWNQLDNVLSAACFMT